MGHTVVTVRTKCLLEVQTNYWNVEDTQQWRTEDTEKKKKKKKWFGKLSVAIQKSIRMDEKCYKVRNKKKPLNISEEAAVKMPMNSCLADRVGGYWNLGIFWAARNT